MPSAEAPLDRDDVVSIMEVLFDIRKGVDRVLDLLATLPHLPSLKPDSAVETVSK